MRWNTKMAKITALQQGGAALGTGSQIAVILTTQLFSFAVPASAAEQWPSETSASSTLLDAYKDSEFRNLEPSEGLEAELEIEYGSRSVGIEPAEVDDESLSSGGLSRERQAVTTTSLELLGGYDFSRRTLARLAIRFSDIRTHGYVDPEAGRGSEWDLTQLWMQTRAPGGANSWIRLGRYEIADRSAWWWDERIDGLTWQGYRDKMTSTIGLWTLPRSMVATDDEPDPDTRDLWWLGGSADWQMNKTSRLTTYALLRTDQSPGYRSDQVIPEQLFDQIDSELAWAGLHSTTHWPLPAHGSVTFQFNGAYMLGSQIRHSDDAIEGSEPDEVDESDESVPIEPQKFRTTGWALDTRLHWRPHALSVWQMTLGYAVASGTRSSDKPGSGTFIQSGLHSNDPDYPRYGYLYNPDLSNLQVLTLGMNIPIGLPGRVHLQHNRYQRYSSTDRLLETDVDIDPDDSHQSLGHETGLGYLLELESGLSVELFAARFTAGRAYGDFHGRHLDQWKMQLTYDF